MHRLVNRVFPICELSESKSNHFSLFSGLILSDLTFVHIGNSDYLQDDRIINFWKRWQQFTILHKLRYCRKWFVLKRNYLF
jgi:hypothetical protein